MNNKIFLFCVIFAAVFAGGFALAQESTDNTYGDYIIANVPKAVSLDLEAANLLDVLKMLSQQTGLNFVSTEAVKDRTLTLYMEKVPLKDAMDIIFKANGLGYDYYPEAGIFVIKELGKPAVELRTKVYRLKYSRVGSSRLSADAKTIGAIGGGSSSRGGGDSGGGGGDLKASLENALTEHGKISEDTLTNSFIITDIPTQFPAIEELLSKLDIPAPQVMIEVEMMDVSRRIIDQLGINYENGLIAKFSGGSIHTPFPFHGTANPSNIYNKYTPYLRRNGETLAEFNLRDLTALIQLLSQDSATKLLARPKIMTLANETAEVNLTVDEVTGLTTNIIEGGSAKESVERKETGTKMRVTPVVNMETREITLFVDVSNRESKDSGISSDAIKTGSFKNIEQRGTKSIVRLKDGETLLMGGLIRKKIASGATKIPFLGDLPVLGTFFRSKSGDSQETELCVFVTPRLIDFPGQESLVVKKTIQREQGNYIKTSAVKMTLDKFSN